MVSSRLAQLAGLIVVCLIVGVGVSIAVADTPQSSAEKKIREALEGKDVSSGDGMLEDVLGVIKRRKSVLEGSSLDPNAPDLLSDGSDKPDPRAKKSQKAHAAEQLLRASRLLESVGTGDKKRDQLVIQMRAEAVKLLSE